MRQSNQKILYEDFVIKIFDDSIIFKHYYNIFIPKIIPFENIDFIEATFTYDINAPLMLLFTLLPSIALTIYERHITYYSLYTTMSDNGKIFIVRFKNKKIRCGFTVKNPEQVEGILKEKFQKSYHNK
jgi:hypothetical protein